MNFFTKASKKIIVDLCAKDEIKTNENNCMAGNNSIQNTYRALKYKTGVSRYFLKTFGFPFFQNKWF